MKTLSFILFLILSQTPLFALGQTPGDDISDTVRNKTNSLKDVKDNKAEEGHGRFGFFVGGGLISGFNDNTTIMAELYYRPEFLNYQSDNTGFGIDLGVSTFLYNGFYTAGFGGFLTILNKGKSWPIIVKLGAGGALADGTVVGYGKLAVGLGGAFGEMAGGVLIEGGYAPNSDFAYIAVGVGVDFGL